MIEGDSHAIMHKSILTALNEEQSLNELRMVCTAAGVWGKTNFLPSGFYPFLRNQSRNVETMVLIWVVTEGRSPKYEGWNFNSGNYLFTTDTK